jgi:hypothetical protein
VKGRRRVVHRKRKSKDLGKESLVLNNRGFQKSKNISMIKSLQTFKIVLDR